MRQPLHNEQMKTELSELVEHLQAFEHNENKGRKVI